jgi:ATP-dependent DNA helicase RecQ
MHAILDSRDSVVVLPTGGGKSLCFQAPALAPNGPPRGGHDGGPPPPRGHGDEKIGVAVIVSPLISLMKDQVDGLRVDGVSASY